MPGASEFPPLPPSQLRFGTWTSDILLAHQIIVEIYNSAARLLRLDQSDPIQLAAHATRVEDEALSLLPPLAEYLPVSWIGTSETILKVLLKDLHDATNEARGRYCITFITTLFESSCHL